MNWSRLAVPVLGLCAIGSFGALLASESLAQSWRATPISEDAFLHVARAERADGPLSDWAGPVASWADAGRAQLRDRPVPIEQSHLESRFVLPLDGWWGITDRFGVERGEGRYHAGIDLGLAGWEGSPVYSACDGVVVVAEPHATYGNYAVVDCGDGWSTVSAHFSQLVAEAGQPVAAGSSILGISGSTGYSTGEHLHFEVHYEGVPIDPELVLGFE